MALDEFGLVERYFAGAQFPVPVQSGVLLGIGDDCAILRMPRAHELLLSIDTLVSGVHFPADMAPELIGHRALAVNLSDLAAMGAEPLWFTLALTLPAVDEAWLEGFSAGLAQLAGRFRVALIGGDTTRGPLSITIQVHGKAPAGGALRRSGAQAGDDVFVSGSPGCAAYGLRLVLAGAASDDERVRAFLCPEPRIGLGLQLRGIASAAIDVSDGLFADAGHIAARSGVHIELDPLALPLGALLEAGLAAADARELCLGGGDDYELCFTAAPAAREAIARIAQRSGVPCTRIGTVSSGAGTGCAGHRPGRDGYRHFGGA